MSLIVYSGGARAGVLDMAADEPFFGFTYDLVSTAVYDGDFGAELSRGMGMRIGARSNIDHVTADDFEQLAKSLGVQSGRLLGIARGLTEALMPALNEVASLLRKRAAEDASELVSRMRKGLQTRAKAIS